MKNDVSSRKDIRVVLNQNIGNIITPGDFTKRTLAGNYLSQLVERKVVERIGRGKYKVLKEIKTMKRKPPVERTRDKVFKANTTKQIKKILNNNVGTIITTQDFSRPSFASNYLYQLIERDIVENIGFGKYKILKKVHNKRRRSKNKPSTCGRTKDLSKIPSILNSSTEGLIMRQIEYKYIELTPPEDQVNRNYLYRLLRFGILQGVVKHNGVNETLRRSNRGPSPKRIVLVNKDITEEEWDSFIAKYIAWYSFKKEESKLKKKEPKIKSIERKSKDIINSFTEERDNPNKSFLESHILDIVKSYIQTPINCMAVTGPDYNRHVDKLFTTIAKKLTIVEYNHGIFKEIVNKASVCPRYLYDNSIDLIKADAANVILPDCLYVDLDLMESLQGIQDIVSHHISYQHYFSRHDINKFITFTASTRNDGGPEKRFEILQNIFLNTGLNIELDGFEGKDLFGDTIPMTKSKETLMYCLKHKPIISSPGRMVDCHIFTYQDTTPMITVLIIYQ